jgi:subtilisin family serine protease
MLRQTILRSSIPLALAAIVSALAFAPSAQASKFETYIVLYREGAGSAGAGAAIQKAGGTVVYNYSEIGVIIARSASSSFSGTMAKDSRVEGVSATSRFAMRVRDDLDSSAEAAAVAVNGPVSDTDTLSPLQWDMVQIHAPEAHAITGGSSDVVVGDIDTGLDYQHPDLAANVDFGNSVSCESGAPDQAPAAWYDNNGHGTHTAGTIAAAANGIGIVGVAPNVKIAGIKSSNDDGFFLPEMVICSFMWAGSHHLDVTNNSYFADPWLFNCRNDHEQHAIWKAEQRAIRYAMSQGVVVVAAAGNENIDLSKRNIDEISPDFPPGNEVTREVTNACVVIPNEIPGVIAVASVGPNATKSFYSTYGVGATDVTAPGGDSTQAGNPFGRVLSTFSHGAPADDFLFYLPRNRLHMSPAGCVDAATGIPAAGCAVWVYLQGTSMASPHVAGVAALIRSQSPDLPAGAVAAALKATAAGIPCPSPRTISGPFGDATCRGGAGYNGFYGHGLVDAEAAVAD